MMVDYVAKGFMDCHVYTCRDQRLINVFVKAIAILARHRGKITQLVMS